MEKLFVIDSGAMELGHSPIHAGAAANIHTRAQIRCRPLQLRFRELVAQTFRIRELHAGVEPLQMDDESAMPFPESGYVHLGFVHPCGGRPVMLEPGMDLTVELFNETGVGRQFYAEVWGFREPQLDTAAADFVWRGYAEQLDEAAAEDKSLQEAFRAGFASGRRFGGRGS